MRIKIKRVRRHFKNWLSKCNGNFQHQPYIADCIPKGDYQTLTIQFQNVPHLCFIINNNGDAGMCVYECQRCWDIIFSCDIYPSKTENKKYYCRACKEFRASQGKEPVFWNSEQEMWKDHVFEVMLTWCNENLTPENVIACFGIPEETSFGAQIIKMNQIEEYKKNAKELNTAFLPVTNPLSL